MTFTFQTHAESVSTAQDPQQPPTWFPAPRYVLLTVPEYCEFTGL